MTTLAGVGASPIQTHHMISAFRANGGEAVAVMSTNADRAASYVKKHGIAHATTSPKELVESKDVDAVYISTTNELHRDPSRRPESMCCAKSRSH
jgi:1,5-anhydro-D-fructose reductase (1,5-anhydro-D-mannitol-forming)